MSAAAGDEYPLQPVAMAVFRQRLQTAEATAIDATTGKEWPTFAPVTPV